MEGFTTKEVLLATKDKLIELEDKLDILKELTYTAGDKNIKEVRYSIMGGSSTKKPDLFCTVEWNDKNLKGRIKNLAVKNGMYAMGHEICNIARDNNGKIYIVNDYYHLSIPNVDQNEFGRMSDEILSDEFVKRFLQDKPYYGDRTYMDVKAYSMFIRGIPPKGYYSVNFKYDPKKCLAYMYADDDYRLTDEMLHGLLNAKLDIRTFSKYKKDLIEESKEKNKDKEIEISTFNTKKKNIEFHVEDSGSKLCLRRINY